jgi:hypothetical protein
MPRSTRSEESRILEYFQEAPLDKANLVLGLVKEAVARRQPIENKPQAKKASRPRGSKNKPAPASEAIDPQI